MPTTAYARSSSDRAPAQRALSGSSASSELANFAPEPLNLIFGYDFSEVTLSNFGIEFSFNIDLSLGYRALMFWMVRAQENLLVLNPNIFLEAASHSWMVLRLGVVEFWFRLDLIGYKFSPVDYQATWSLDQYSHYCHSMSYIQDVFDVDILIETRVDECHIGVFGFLNDDPVDCTWRRYYPQIPLFEVSVLEEWDLTEDYLEWQCNYFEDVDSGSSPSEPNNIEDPYVPDEPSNIVE